MRNYQQGSVNLFLHEHAHTLDTLYGQFSISKSKQYLEALAAFFRNLTSVKELLAREKNAN